jgi:23S rRNA pseudouridine955/2504/2580 synthase
MSSATENPAPGVRYLEVDPARAGQRLDNFLVGVLKGVPKSHVYRLLRRGEVRVNRGRARPDYRLQAGDVVRLPPVRTAVPAERRSGQGFEWLGERVLYEDEQLLVLDKPAGLAVHGGSGVSIGLIEALRGLRPQAPLLELAHRLDRDTSGCLLIAKDRAALLALHRMLREGAVHKHYLALVKGRWRGGPRRVEATLARRRDAGGAARVHAGDGEGKEAASRFSPKRACGPGTLVEIELYTGRTHQARAHAAHIGHPIAGDDKYGDWEFNRALRAAGLKRLFLHAARLELRHPVTAFTLRFESPLPVDLVAVLERLESAP